MKAHVFHSIESALCSLTDSTNLFVATRGVGAQYRRRNSPYKSHQAVEFKRFPDVVGGVLFSNSQYTVLVGDPRPLTEAELRKLEPRWPVQMEGGDIPVDLIPQELCRLARRHGHGWFESCNVVQVLVLRRVLSGYDADGKPVFVESWPEQAEAPGCAEYFELGDVA